MTIPGGWDTYSCKISQEAATAFEEAVTPIKGVRYTPVAVSQQVVSGMNYSFFCNAKGVYPDSMPQGAIVEVYKPLNDKAQITKIKILDH